MNNKAKSIALCAFSAALAVGCMAAMAIPGVKWAALILAVGASVSLTVPMLFDTKNLKYVLLAYVAASAVGILAAMANICYVLPVVTFCMPFAIVKVYGENTYVCKNLDTPPTPTDEKIDPFAYDKNRPTTPQSEQQTEYKQRISRKVRFVVYYILLEVGLAATLLAVYLVMPSFFQTLMQQPILLAALIVAAQTVPPLFDLLLGGCIRTIKKSLNRFFDR